MSDSQIPLAAYLWSRIASLGIQHVFGVPGDFNLTLLDFIDEASGLTWLGTCNELNAAYAADGYARIKNTPAALVTTYAVGELSAMNGVAGAYAEHAGMIHIVGMPSRKQQSALALLHHTLEPGMDHKLYVGMSAPIRQSCAVLLDEQTMASEIDRVIVECHRSRLPGYIYIPTDVVTVPLERSRLDHPLDVSVHNLDGHAEVSVVQGILEAIKKASKPAILVDAMTARHGGQDVVREIVELTQFPSYSTHLSRGVVDESSPSYNGVYNGQVSFAGIQEAVESSDLVINVGPLLSDSNTGGFTRNISDDKLVVLAHGFCQIRSKKFSEIHFLPVLKRVAQALRAQPKEYDLPRRKFWQKIQAPLLSDMTSGPIVQAYLWQRIGRFLRPNDIVFAESGTAQFGMQDAALPTGATLHTQIFWSSIGYTVGAGLGACIAAKELKNDDDGRVVIIIGDGSLHMTVQEIGSYIRFGLRPLVFIINNDGYSIERAIHGPKQGYNDISPHWDYQRMLEFFGANAESGIPGRSHRCRSIAELEAVLNDEQFCSAEVIQVCEVVTDKFDYPWRLSAQLEISRAKMAAS